MKLSKEKLRRLILEAINEGNSPKPSSAFYANAEFFIDKLLTVLNPTSFEILSPVDYKDYYADVDDHDLTTIYDNLLNKLGILDLPIDESPVILVAIFGEDEAEERFYILIYPSLRASMPGEGAGLNFITVQHFYFEYYEEYYLEDRYKGNIDVLVNDIATGIYRDSGL